MKRSLLLFLAVFIGLLPTTVLAHGGGTPRVTAVPAGPYLVYVWSSPDPSAVGENHFTIGVTLPGENGAETPVTDAEVFITFQYVAPVGDAMKLTAEPGAGGGVYYEVDALLENAGNWQANIEINGKEGAGFLAFPLNVTPANNGQQWLVWVVAGVAVMAAVGAVLLLRGNRKHSQATKK